MVMFKKIDRLFWTPLSWEPIKDNVRDFECDRYPKEECLLRMNDFPEEPLWTLFFMGAQKDFDDKPLIWKIKYRSEK